LFIGGGIFYGLKIWQGTALGCPEPIIQEIVKNHHEGISPYHGHTGGDIISSYPGPPPDVFGGYADYSGVYSHTPSAPSPTYSGPTYLPPSNSYLPPSGSSNSYLPPSGGSAPASPDSYTRRQSSTGRQISEQSVTIFSDLIFRFLGVNTEQCRRRFVCELEFRNPFMRYAVKYVG
jgi:hypothetical protein